MDRAVAPYFAYVYYWHFSSPLAKRLPGYGQFGGFYRFLTFWTFALQNLQLIAAALNDLFPQLCGERWRRTVGRTACVVVCAASTVTTMYYGIRAADKNALDPPETRVVWVNATVHGWNSIVAWCDVLCSTHRDFGPSDRAFVVLYTFAYSTWLLYLKLVTDAFPYPFLNTLPPLLGWGVICFAGLCFMLFYFALAKRVRGWFEQLGRCKDVTA